jgi:type IX secretion system PorP/SprF family membrane protein
MKRNIIGLSLFCGLSLIGFGQQESVFTHYIYNTSSVNPAYAGSREALSMTLLNRFQWVGFDGAPLTNTLNINTPLWQNRLGVGLSLQNDKIGPSNTTLIEGDFAYRMKLTKKLRLNFGIKGGIGLFNANLSNVITTDGNDPVFSKNISWRNKPNFGLGLLLQHERFYIGLSAPKLLESTSGDIQGVLAQKRHYYGIAGIVFPMGSQWKFKPTFALKYVPGARIQGDFTAGFMWKEKFNLGLAYRSNDAIAGMIGFQITEPFMIGYSFDYSMNVRTGTTNLGSHELMLRYELIYNRGANVKSPRYF